MGNLRCDNCGYEFKLNEGCYNTPSGLFCCNCYNHRGMKKKVYSDLKKQPPLAINLGRMAMLSVGVDNRPKNKSSKYAFVRIIVNDLLYPEWYFVCNNKTDVYYHFEKYYQPIIRLGVEKMMRGDYETVWGKTILKIAQSPKYCDLSPCMASINLENETYLNRCNLVNDGKILLLNKDNMSYFTLNENVKILQEKTSEFLRFPNEEKYCIDDIIIKRWDNGIHYYAKIGPYDIISNEGEVKYYSYNEAHTECLKWLERQ